MFVVHSTSTQTKQKQPRWRRLPFDSCTGKGKLSLKNIRLFRSELNKQTKSTGSGGSVFEKGTLNTLRKWDPLRPEVEVETSNRTHVHKTHSYTHSHTHMHAIYCREGENRRANNRTILTNKQKHKASVRTEEKNYNCFRTLWNTTVLY